MKDSVRFLGFNLILIGAAGLLIAELAGGGRALVLFCAVVTLVGFGDLAFVHRRA
jgi:hypothetical protein